MMAHKVRLYREFECHVSCAMGAHGKGKSMQQLMPSAIEKHGKSAVEQDGLLQVLQKLMTVAHVVRQPV